MSKKVLVLVSLLTISCTTITNEPVSKLETVKSPVPSSSKSLFPTNIPLTSPTAQATITPLPTAIITSAPLKDSNGSLNLKTAFLKTPNTPFLVDKNFTLEFSFSVEKLPLIGEKYTVFDVYDQTDDPKNAKSHYSLTIDENNNLLLNANTTDITTFSDSFSNKLNINQNYEFKFKRIGTKIELLINNQMVYSKDLKFEDFEDLLGKRTFTFGANMNGNNKMPCKINYIKVPDVLYYAFKGNLYDSEKYALNAYTIGDGYEIVYKNSNQTIIPSTTPTPTATATPEVSSTLYPEKIVGDNQGTRIRLSFNTYDPSNFTQYSACMDNRTKELDRISNSNGTYTNANLKDCKNVTGNFYSNWFDFSTSKESTNGSGDFRFLATVFEEGYNNTELKIAGNNASYQTLIDIGNKSYDSIDLDYLKNKVDYTNKNKIYSDSTISNLLKIEHLYALRTYQYGLEPKYAKIFINDIITNDYSAIKLKSQF